MHNIQLIASLHSKIRVELNKLQQATIKDQSSIDALPVTPFIFIDYFSCSVYTGTKTGANI